MLAKDLHTEQKNYANFDHAKAFLLVVEQLKSPLTYIARQTEYVQTAEELADIRRTVEANLALLDSLTIAMQIYAKQTDVSLRPVMLSSVLYDVAQVLDAYSKQMGCRFELLMSKNQHPVMSNGPGLMLALVNLGYEFITAQTFAGVPTPAVTLATHTSRQNAVAGLYAQGSGITTDVLRKARRLYGGKTQPFPAFSIGNGAGIYMADALLRAVSSRLRASRYHKQQGLATSLPMVPQLTIV